MNILPAIADQNLFRPHFRDLSTWQAWFAWLASLFALEPTPDQ